MTRGNTVVDTEVLSNIHRKISIRREFSKDLLAQEEEKKQIVNVLSEPVHRLEFDVLLSLLTKLEHKPYKSMNIQDRELRFKTVDLDVPLPESFSFLTLDYDVHKGYHWFTLKPAFRTFSDAHLINSDCLYDKLFGLCVSNRLKTMYYFLSKYKYNFVNIISENYCNLYTRLQQVDDYLGSLSYHRYIMN